MRETRIDNKEYLIDAGNATPFFEPLPTFLTEDYVIKFGNEKYIIKPKDEFGRTKVEQFLMESYSIGTLQNRKKEISKISEK